MNARRNALAAACLLALLSFPALAQSDSLKDKPAPAFDLPTLSGDGTISLEDLRGKIVVLHFGAGW